MTLVAVAADKGAPGVTTACVALAAVWPRAVLLAECDPAGGDLAYRLPAADGTPLDPQRGLLSLAVAARRGSAPDHVWAHTQKLRGGLDVLAGVVTPEQGAGLEQTWGPVGTALAHLPQADVVADCGRLGTDGRHYDLLAQASLVLLVTRASLEEVVRLRERVGALRAALLRRDRAPLIGVAVVADHRHFHAAVTEVGAALGAGTGRGQRSPGAGRDAVPVADGGMVGVLGGLAYEPRSADALRGEWGGRLDRSMLIRTARDLAARIAAYVGPAPAHASATAPSAASATVPPAPVPPAPVPPAPVRPAPVPPTASTVSAALVAPTRPRSAAPPIPGLPATAPHATAPYPAAPRAAQPGVAARQGSAPPAGPSPVSAPYGAAPQAAAPQAAAPSATARR